MSGVTLIIDESQTCSCFCVPLIWWKIRDGDWFVGSACMYVPDDMLTEIALLDRDRAMVLGVTTFRVACPSCGLLIAEGVMDG